MLMDFPSPVIMSDRQLDFTNSLHLLISSRSLPLMPSLRKSSIVKESCSLWISWFEVFPSRTKFCSHSNFQVFEIHLLLKHLIRLELLFVNSGTENPTSKCFLSSEALSCFPVIESVFPKFIRAIMCFMRWF